MRYSIKKQHSSYSNQCIVDESEKITGKLGIRHLQSLLLFLAVFTAYIQRVHLSVTFVALTKNEGNATVDVSSKFSKYPWDNTIKNYIHSSFFIGYLFMNFPAAVLGRYFDNKKLLLISFSISGMLSFITPFVINFEYIGNTDLLHRLFEASGPGNWKVIIIIRALQGLFQAFTFPTCNFIIARWAPPNERSRLGGFMTGGAPFGAMVTFIVSGFLCSSAAGWPSVFYVSGSIGFVWCIIWFLFGSNSPDEHKTISQTEYTYICNNIAANHSHEKKSIKIPWKAIFTSWRVWAVVVANTGYNWGFWLLLDEMPTYIHDVLNFDVKSDSLLASFPYLTSWLLLLPVMYIADYFNKHKITSITASRKIFNSLGMWGASIGLLTLGYVDNNETYTVILYIVCVTCGCFSHVGCNLNPMDLSPNYAGIITGIANGVGSSGGLGAPLLAGYIVKNTKSILEWRRLFYVGAVITFVSNLLYVIFGSAKTQHWNDE